MPSFRHWPIWATCSSFFSRDIKNCLWRNRVPMMMISVVEQIIMMVIMVLMMTKITNKHTNIITFWRKLLFLATFTLSGIFSPEMFNPMRHGNTVFWLPRQYIRQCLKENIFGRCSLSAIIGQVFFHRQIDQHFISPLTTFPSPTLGTISPPVTQPECKRARHHSAV